MYRFFQLKNLNIFSANQLPEPNSVPPLPESNRKSPESRPQGKGPTGAQNLQNQSLQNARSTEKNFPSISSGTQKSSFETQKSSFETDKSSCQLSAPKASDLSWNPFSNEVNFS